MRIIISSRASRALIASSDFSPGGSGAATRTADGNASSAATNDARQIVAARRIDEVILGFLCSCDPQFISFDRRVRPETPRNELSRRFSALQAVQICAP